MGHEDASEGTFAPGETVPGTRYRVERILDAGGMSVIYEVCDTTIGKIYVLKALHGHLAGRGDFVERLETEARTVARLAHPNIVSVITAGRTSDALALPYFVMERLQGRNLREVLRKRGRLELLHALPIVTDVLAALEHAHGNGVVHRDVKPENIYLHRVANGSTTAKLLDFGILGFVDDSAPREDLGATIRYASPEQLEAQRVGAATDLYAAGLVLFEMIAGRGPFDCGVHDLAEIARAHIERPAPRLDATVPDRELPEALVALVASALEKDPQSRPVSARAFRAALLDLHRDEVARAGGEERAAAIAPLFSVPPPPADAT